ncbi:hypothetical protein [Salegentibacter maritimus]|uniref:Uncharacterized protein n=1 Tax=Salegentibacter maritimus TaxID=2794347 RepID=A0ABS0TK64_9FLAO|nr:hypothetical protein [Salegentibacter maritimus]MBI6121453.1 hypothetical protein [Salegentibacter maritimus]
MNRLSDQTFQEYYKELFDNLKIRIASEDDDYIIVQPTDDLVSYYIDETLEPIVFNTDKDETLKHDKFIKTIPSYERDSMYQHNGDLKIECEKLIVMLPIIPNGNTDKILKLRTQSISISGSPDITIKGALVIIELEIKGYRIDLSDDQIEKEILNRKESIKSHINSKNFEMNKENKKLEKNLTQFIEERKIKLDSDKKRLSGLVNRIKIPLARKNSDLVKKIRVEKKPFIKKIKPRTPDEDYILDREKVIDIIQLINNQCIQFEKTPFTYQNFHEPNLRDLILANLNSIFEGSATGETFNNKGKSDIYLNIDKGNILVAECKIYEGKKLYHDTIDQLLGYLTWRQNFGIMVNFCKRKNFSKVLTDAEEIIKSHQSFQSDFRSHEKAHLISKHSLPGDDYKYVEIHHLYYNLYVE